MTNCRASCRILPTLILAMFLPILVADSAWALDSKVIRDIDRADTIVDLADLADKVANEAATRQPKDFEEGTQIASETSTYLLYIIAKQNTLLLKME